MTTTASEEAPKRMMSRRNSFGLMEEHASDWTSANSWIFRKFHDLVYPPNSQWYWYRRGRISHTALDTKYMKLMASMFMMALAASGHLFPLILILYSAFVRQVYEFAESGSLRFADAFDGINATEIARGSERPSWFPIASTWWFIILQCLASGVVTCGVYVANGMYIIKKFYVERAHETELWKCQPNNFLTPDRWREEKMLGSFNAFFAGVYGTFLYFVHLNWPFLKLYYETESRGYLHFFASALACYLWIDFYSYWAHRALHTRFMYRNIHKVHHRYKHPTPFSAFALHPIEFLVFQSAGILQAAFVPIHIAGYLVVVLFVAYHNQLDHSGVAFEGDLPWMPATKYHDDHHLYFHLNFGLHLVFWDWIGGTLRSKQRVYGEDRFVGDQNQKDAAANKEVDASTAPGDSLKPKEE